MKALNKLGEYDKNNKDHPQEQIDILKQNILKFGFTTPLLISKDNTIIAGHGRKLAADEIGMKEVPCIVIDDLSEDEKVKLFIGYSIKEIYPKCREDLKNKYNIQTTDDMEIMVAIAVSRLFGLVDCQSIKTGKDVYMQVIDYFSKQLTEVFYMALGTLIKRDEPDTHAKFIEAMKLMLHSANNIFNYESPIRHTKRNGEDDSTKEDSNKRTQN